MTANARAFLEDVLPRMKSVIWTCTMLTPPCELRCGPTTKQCVVRRGVPGEWLEQVGSVFEKLAAQFSDCSSFEVEVVAADAGGDLGYVVAIERTTASIGGRPPRHMRYESQQVFRCEDGEWKVVHRHGDAYEDSAIALASQLRDNS